MLKLSKPLTTIGDRAILAPQPVTPCCDSSVGPALHRSLGSAALVCLVATGLTTLQGNITPAMASAAATPPQTATANAATAPAFRTAVNAAMHAAQLSQTAKTASDWQQIIQSWELAIAQMKAVPASDSNAAIAQRKAVEYTKNLDYAHQALTRQTAKPAAKPATSPAKPIAVRPPKANKTQTNKTKPHVVQQGLTVNPLPALLQAPLQTLQANPWLGKGAIVLAAATGLISLLTLEMKPTRARKTISKRRDREAENIFFSNIGKGLSGIVAQIGDLPLQPSAGPLKSDKVQRKLFRKLVLLAKDEATAVRLIKGYLQRHPEHSMDWCCEKAILDLQQST